MILQWAVGNRVVIGTSDFNWTHSEERVISAIGADRVTLTLSAPLQWRHHGSVQTFARPDGFSWTLDERAEVANLERSIRISTATPAVDAVGAHVIVTRGGVARVDGVSFTAMGQAGRMGRYPMHWHRVANASGQYLRNSAVLHSFQRCVTVHGTNQVLVDTNVCYNFTGHGFFLEDGNETGNRFLGNLGMRAQRVSAAKALLQSDTNSATLQRQRFDSPSVFWVSNPDNELQGNVASGSQGSGFWMAFSGFLDCGLAGCVLAPNASVANTFPAYQRSVSSPPLTHSLTLTCVQHTPL